MECYGYAAFVLGNAARIQIGEEVVIDSHPELDGNRNLACFAHGSSHDIGQQAGANRDGCASPLPGDLADGATEIHVDMVDPVFTHEQRHGLAHVFGVHPIELQATGRFRRIEAGQLERLRISFHQRPSGNHFAHVEARSEVPAEGPERIVGDPRHGSEDDRGVQLDGPDPNRREFSGPGGPNVAIDRADIFRVHGPIG